MIDTFIHAVLLFHNEGEDKSITVLNREGSGRSTGHEQSHSDGDHRLAALNKLRESPN